MVGTRFRGVVDPAEMVVTADPETVEAAGRGATVRWAREVMVAEEAIVPQAGVAMAGMVGTVAVAAEKVVRVAMVPKARVNLEKTGDQ